jgi:hypothetical protein
MAALCASADAVFVLIVLARDCLQLLARCHALACRHRPPPNAWRAQKICLTFESTPNDTTRILALMQEVQQYGAPPKDIVADFMRMPGMGMGMMGAPPAGAGAAGAGAGAGAATAAGGAAIPPFGPVPPPGLGGAPPDLAALLRGMPDFNEAELSKLMGSLPKGGDDCKMQ